MFVAVLRCIINIYKCPKCPQSRYAPGYTAAEPRQTTITPAALTNSRRYAIKFQRLET